MMEPNAPISYLPGISLITTLATSKSEKKHPILRFFFSNSFDRSPTSVSDKSLSSVHICQTKSNLLLRTDNPLHIYNLERGGFEKKLWEKEKIIIISKIKYVL